MSKNWSQAEHYIDVKVDLAEMDITSAESKATYRQIKDWVKENYGIKTRNEVRREEGLKDIEGADALTAQTNLAPVSQLGTENFDPSQTAQTKLTTQPEKQ